MYEVYVCMYVWSVCMCTYINEKESINLKSSMKRTIKYRGKRTSITKNRTMARSIRGESNSEGNALPISVTILGYL